MQKISEIDNINLNDTGKESTVKILIENGADIDAINNANNSALILSIFGGFEKIAELLIQNGADVNIVGKFNATALLWAAGKGE